MKGLNKRSLFLTSFLFALFLISLVQATTNVASFISPNNTGYMKTATQNISFILDANNNNFDNASFYYTSDGENWVVIGNVSNKTANALVWSTTFSTTGFLDSDSIYQFNISMTNQTYQSGMAAATAGTNALSSNISVDNGQPTATFYVSQFQNSYSARKNDIFKWGLDADSTIGITNCSLIFINTGNNSMVTRNIVSSGNSCSNETSTPTNFGLPLGETYTARIQATDANGNSTNSTDRTLITIGTTGSVQEVTVVPQKSGVIAVLQNLPNKARGLGLGLANAISNVPDFARGILETIKSWFNR